MHIRVSTPLCTLPLERTNVPLLFTARALARRVRRLTYLVTRTAHVGIVGRVAPALGTSVQVFATRQARDETALFAERIDGEFTHQVHIV